MLSPCHQEREKEGLLEKISSLESATQDNVKLAQKVAHLEAQVGKARLWFWCQAVERFGKAETPSGGRCGTVQEGLIIQVK